MPDERSRDVKIEARMQEFQESKTGVSSYSKVYNLGHREVEELLVGKVYVEEKVDGSQFSFVKRKGVLRFRSKSTAIDMECAPNIFVPAIQSVLDVIRLLPDGFVFRGEAFAKPKHNTIKYGRVPKGNVVIFDIDALGGGQKYILPLSKKKIAEDLGFEVAPLVWEGDGKHCTMDTLKAWLGTESFLGGSKIEGVVIKNYERYDRSNKILMGKYVSEAFKESHRTNWKSSNPAGAEIREALAMSLRTEARWEKAVQHLRDKGVLQDSVQDIGLLFKEVQKDVLDDHKVEIERRLFKWAWNHISRRITAGLAEWYKAKLAGQQFDLNATKHEGWRKDIADERAEDAKTGAPKSS